MWYEITHGMSVKDFFYIISGAVTALITGASLYLMAWSILTLGD